MRDALTGLTDLLVPFRCAGCDLPGTGWCLACAQEIGGLRRVDRPLLPAYPPAYSLGRYRAAARRGVLAYKESGRRDLAEPFGHALAKAVQNLGDGPWCLIPAPSRRIVSRRRGGAHMARVGRRAVSALVRAGVSAILADCLLLRAGARDSVGLGPAERIGNLTGRLHVRPRGLPRAGVRAVLFDDVITTGATAATCLASLEGTGLPVRAIIALTATVG